MTLNEFFAAHPKCALGFSGGVDSAYLLYAGVRACLLYTSPSPRDS